MPLDMNYPENLKKGAFDIKLSETYNIFSNVKGIPSLWEGWLFISFYLAQFIVNKLFL